MPELTVSQLDSSLLAISQLGFSQLTTMQCVGLAIATMGIGFSKAGFPGVSMLHVVVFALCFGAKASTGILLPMLIVGDCCAIVLFGRRAVWPEIFRLLPPTLVGILAGWLMMDWLDPNAFRWIVGMIILTLAILQAYRMLPAGEKRGGADQSDSDCGDADLDAADPDAADRANRIAGSPEIELVTEPELEPSRHVVSGMIAATSLGSLAGLTTMLANAAGPVVAMYLLLIRLPKWELIGTSAWLFLVLNILKLPLSYDLGLINQTTLRTGATLAPLIPLGMLAGRWLVHRISQHLFNAILLAFTAVMALRMIIG